MRRLIWAFWLGCAAALVAPPAAAGCTRAMPEGAVRTVVPAADVDQRLFNRAVLAEVNYRRCRRGVRALRAAGSLVRAAAGHSRWMAETGNLSHRSSRPGRRSLGGRIHAAGLAFNTAMENIGLLHRYPVDAGRVRILDRARCRFSRNGRPLGPHSYASLARYAVRLWMRSPDHRKNLLNPRIAYAGAAVAFSPGARYCGRYWLTQAFIG